MALFDQRVPSIYERVIGNYFIHLFENRKMSKLAFYGHPLSPFARMAHMTLELLGIDYDFRKIDLQKGEQKEEWYLKINPKVKFK